MSRIGKKPIPIPEGVRVEARAGRVSIQGPKGTLERQLHPDMAITVGEGEIAVTPARQTRRSGALWGLTRSLVANMVEGVTRGFEKKLEFEGIGYRANLELKSLVLQMGFTHPIRIEAPPGITFSLEKNVITISGPDKELVGNTAARIRRVRPPEPYKGKGIRYQGELIRRKAGKKAITTTL